MGTYPARDVPVANKKNRLPHNRVGGSNATQIQLLILTVDFSVPYFELTDDLFLLQLARDGTIPHG